MLPETNVLVIESVRCGALWLAMTIELSVVTLEPQTSSCVFSGVNVQMGVAFDPIAYDLCL